MGSPRLQERVGSPCPYCTRTMIAGHMKLRPTSDHIQPKSKNKRRFGRTIVVCSECNFMKDNLTLNQFMQSLVAKNEALLVAVETNNERIRNIEYLVRIGLEE